MKTKPVLSFTVKESKWRCGVDGLEANARGKGETRLLNDFGFKCCLGFACQQAGFKGAIKNQGRPKNMGAVIKGLTFRDSDGQVKEKPFVSEAIQINDDPHTNISMKKKALVALGKRHNIEVNFVP